MLHIKLFKEISLAIMLGPGGQLISDAGIRMRDLAPARAHPPSTAPRATTCRETVPSRQRSRGHEEGDRGRAVCSGTGCGVARARVDAATFESGWAVGQAMTEEQAITEALQDA